MALARAIGKSEGAHPSTRAWAAGLAFQTLVAVYGGFFGAGMGIVMLAALAITEGDDFHLINSAKHLCSTLIQLVAVVLFIAAGLVSWHELYAGNGQAAAFRFYSDQFGWETLERMDMGAMGEYRIFGEGGVPMGGMMDKPADTPAAAWAFYVNVDGLDAAIARIQAHGGQVLMGPHEVPGGSWIVQALDPQGANFALVSTRR